MVQLPSGGTERIYISQDNKLKTVRTEMHTKKVEDVLTRPYPQHTFYPQRGDGLVAARYRPIVRLDLREERTTLLFNEATLAEMEIDKGDVIRAWEREAATPAQSVEWRSLPHPCLLGNCQTPGRESRGDLEVACFDSPQIGGPSGQSR